MLGNDIKTRIRSVGPKKSFNSIEIVPIMQTVSSTATTTPAPSSLATAATHHSTKCADAVATTDAYHVQNSSNLFNNNQTSTSSCSSSDLKYLHKKFKRIASTSVDADVAPTPVAQPLPEPPTTIAIDRSVHFNGYSVISTTKAGPAPVAPAATAASQSSSGGRYVCPFCQLNCTKPSVLRKHIRAHTNERPYPCVPCGFAFKTKSNLHKHYR